MTPYYERNGITIYCGDCLEVMPQLDGPFDAIIADLPYGTTACDWDSIIPLEPLWVEYKRLIKDNGAVVLFGSQPFTSRLVMSNLEWFKYEWVWDKCITTSPGLAKYRPLPVCEMLLVFGKDTIVFNPQMELGHEPYAKKNGTRAKTGNKHKYGYKGGFLSISNGERYPKQIITFSNANQTLKEHPTQKPVALLQYLIRTYTNPGDIILDNTAGSGTTGVAAQNEGRRCVMIEQDEEYCKVMVDRLRQPSFFSLPAEPEPQPEQAGLFEARNVD